MPAQPTLLTRSDIAGRLGTTVTKLSNVIKTRRRAVPGFAAPTEYRRIPGRSGPGCDFFDAETVAAIESLWHSRKSWHDDARHRHRLWMQNQSDKRIKRRKKRESRQ